jgi:hypothetical protein
MRCQRAPHHAGMANIIPVQFRPSRLPRRLLNDGWWLETKPLPPVVIAFPARSPPALKPTGSDRTRGHLTLVISEK